MRWVIMFALLGACGDNVKPQLRDDAGIDAPTPDGPPQRLTGCLEQPGLPAAPNGALPCDLVPPGLQL